MLFYMAKLPNHFFSFSESKKKKEIRQILKDGFKSYVNRPKEDIFMPVVVSELSN